MLWQIRAEAEYAACPRTLFGTITMSPEQHYLMDAEIMAGRMEKGRIIRYPQRLEQLSHEELFSWRVRVFGEKLQKYLKRLRAKANEPECIRYLLVAEAHNSARTTDEMRGRPHFHMLAHEQTVGSLVYGDPLAALQHGEDGSYIRKKYQSGNRWYEGIFVKDNANLREQWEFGHTKFQFAMNKKAASYLCKYLSKSDDAKVRASLKYGENTR